MNLIVRRNLLRRDGCPVDHDFDQSRLLSGEIIPWSIRGLVPNHRVPHQSHSARGWSGAMSDFQRRLRIECDLRGDQDLTGPGQRDFSTRDFAVD